MSTLNETTVQINMGELWEQYKRFYFRYANRYYNQYSERCAACGVEKDDLIQSCFLALHRAAQTHDETAGAGLLGYSLYYVKSEFAALMGYRSRRETSLNGAVSFDAPLNDAENLTYGDTLTDENAAKALEQVLDHVQNEQLAAVLWACVDELNPEQAHAIKGLYRQGRMAQELADEQGLTYAQIQHQHHDSIQMLRKPRVRRKLMPFYEEMLIARAYRNTGLNSFRNNGASSVELACERAEQYDLKGGEFVGS